jgi:flagellar basal-body rod protein FlgC
MSRAFSVAGVFSALEVAGAGLSAERGRMNLIASNLANAHTTRAANGQPYRRLDPVFSTVSIDPTSSDAVLRQTEAVTMTGMRADPTPGQLVYEPGHPDANPQGYVQYPNVNVVTEMVNMMTASRAYEAGVSSIESLKSMARDAIKIGQ